MVVRAGPSGPGTRVGAEDVVVDEQVVVAGVFESLDEGDDLVRIDPPELRLREDGSESHRHMSSISQMRSVNLHRPSVHRTR